MTMGFRFRRLALVALGAGVSACSAHHHRHPMSQPAAVVPPAVQHAVAIMHAAAGQRVQGAVDFRAGSDARVRIVADLSGLPPKSTHGFHIHEFGDCSAPDFASAGGHFNPDNHPHAGPDAPAHHAGDLGNVTADEKGHAHLELTVDGITLDGGTHGVLGRGVILHSQADDLATQPTGDAGARIACGVIGAAKN